MMTIEPRIIRTEQQYEEYFERIQQLISLSPQLGSKQSDELEVLSILVEDYEKQKYPVEAPDPVDAILFRMSEKNLKQADLVPYFGTRSRVSEVLSRKRPLTVPMIRALATGLGISSDTLLGLGEIETVQKPKSIDWNKFPIKEMITRGWLDKITDKAKNTTEEMVKNFISTCGLQPNATSFRRTLTGEASTASTEYTLYAWVARIIQKSRQQRGTATYSSNFIDQKFIKNLCQLSRHSDGPVRALNALQEIGISVVIEPQLKGTMLDGAALMDSDGTPIIGLTLRNDRIDNFWFTLIHEVAHIWKHVTDPEVAILDNLERPSENKQEAEANRIAKDSLIPRAIWKRSEAFLNPSKETINKLSSELRIHPAIVAGRLRAEKSNYAIFSDMVGQGEVRQQLIEQS